MNRLTGKRILAVIAVLFAAAFFAAPKMTAQEAAGAADVKQEVPDNPAEHAPPEQPIPYSHKVHLALGLPCATCHTNPDPGNLMTFPATAKCMSCHHSIAKNKPSIRKLAAYSKSGETIPGCRVYSASRQAL